MENQAKQKAIYPEYPRYFCRKCHALAVEAKKFYKFSKKIDEPKIECPICGLTYIYTEDFSREEFGDYLANIGCTIRIDAVDKHRTILLHRADSIIPAADTGPREVADILGEFLPHARSFMHLTLTRLTPAVYRMLAGTKGSVPVRVISTGVDDDLRKEIGSGAGKQNLLEISFSEGTAAKIPHDKILVVDGLVAVTGKTVASGKETHYREEVWENVRAETESSRIISSHNRLFSPHWGATSGIGDKIFMDPA